MYDKILVGYDGSASSGDALYGSAAMCMTRGELLPADSDLKLGAQFPVLRRS
jgi:hypothetical protein